MALLPTKESRLSEILQRALSRPQELALLFAAWVAVLFANTRDDDERAIVREQGD